MLQLLKRDQLPAAKALLDDAFAPSRFESRLLELAYLREANAPCYVWQEDDAILGCILYTPAFRDEQEIGYHLAPVAVHPDYQRKGIGLKMIRQTLALTPMAESPVFVLGDPAYYERFSFAPTKNAQCPYDPGNAHFRALRWSDDYTPFTLGYCAAFAEAEK